MKKIISLLLIFSMLISLLSGCYFSFGNKDKDDPKNTDPPTSDTPNGGDPQDWEPGLTFEREELFEFLGDATFTIDNEAMAQWNNPQKAFGEFKADGTPLTLECTDINGLVWTLEIPAGALLFPEQITMFAMTSASIDGLGDMDGGVLMMPDGLTFLQSAKLTVTGDGFGEDSIMFQADHDGSNVTFVEYDTDTNCMTAKIRHFSTITGSKTGRSRNASRAERQYDKALEAAKKLLKQPIGDLPPPPSFSFECPAYHRDWDINTRAMANFLKDFKEPENKVLLALTAALSTYYSKDLDKRMEEFEKAARDWDGSDENFKKLFGDPEIFNKGYDSSMTEEEEREFFIKSMRGTLMGDMMDMVDGLVTVFQLFERLGHKGNKLIDQYKYKEEKFLAVAAAVSFYNITFGAAWVRKGEIHKWSKELWNVHIKELAENHDYTRVHALIAIFGRKGFHQMIIWGNEQLYDMSIDEFQQRISDALTFELKYNTELIGKTNHGAFIFKTKAEFECIKMELGDGDIIGRATDVGTYEGPTSDGDWTLILPNDFTTTATVGKFDPCIEQTVLIGFDELAASHELYRTKEGDTVGIDGGIAGGNMSISYWWSQIFVYAGDYYDWEYGIAFPCPLQNKQQEAAHEVFSAASDDMRVTITITLTHTPEGDLYLK